MTEKEKSQATTQTLLPHVEDRDDSHTTSFPADLPKFKVLRTLKLLGFFYVRKGRHLILHRENADGTKSMLALPDHKNINHTTLLGACAKAGVSREDFLSAYYSM